MRRFPHVMFGCFAAALAASAVGCDWMPGRPEQLRKDVLAADPSFAPLLEKRDELANQIALMKQELELKRTQVERQIAQLRQELSGATAQVNEKIRSTKAELASEQDRVELDRSMGREELKIKQSQRASLGNHISRIRKSLNDPNRQWAAADRKRMDHERGELLEETKRLDGEISALKQHLKLLDIKRRLLQL